MNANLDIEMDCVYRVFILAQFERVALRVYVICMLRSFRTRVALGPPTIHKIATFAFEFHQKYASNTKNNCEHL